MLALTLGQLHGRGAPVPWMWVRRLAGGEIRWGTVAVIAYLSLVVASFLYWLPILYGFMIPEVWYQSLMWLPSWV
jgi:dolichyl-phosphate-mannose--protein O-mannosyl transferase